MKKVFLAAAVAGAFLAVSCVSKNATITTGNLSKFDTLSYAVGINLASITTEQLADLPLDYDALVESLISTAKGENKLSQDSITSILQDYFMNKRQPRMAEIEKARDEADSIALANGADADVVSSTRRALAADSSMFEDETERKLISTALGGDLGNSIVTAKIPVQTVWVEKAFADLVAEEPVFNNDVANSQIQNYFTVVLPAKQLEESNKWLASIESKSGVEKTESGLLYKIETAGDESLIAVDDKDTVVVKYTGKNKAGEVFDSSRYADMPKERLEYLKSQNPNGELPADGETVEFALNRVIKGWTEGMKLVGKGGRISLWIPSELAYGPRSVSEQIGANEALYFDGEIVDVIPYVAPVTAPAEDAE